MLFRYYSFFSRLLCVCLKVMFFYSYSVCMNNMFLYLLFFFFFGIVYTIFCVLLLFCVMHNTQVLVFGVVFVELRKTLSSERSGSTKIYDYYKIWNWNTHIEVIKYYLNVLKFMLLYLQWHIHGKWGI